MKEFALVAGKKILQQGCASKHKHCIYTNFKLSVVLQYNSAETSVEHLDLSCHLLL